MTYFISMTQRKDSLREVVEGIDLDDLIKFVNSTLVSQYKDLESIAVINQNEIKDIKDVIYRSLSIFAGEESYNSFEKKIAFIFYSIVKGHFLNNGNKRTGAGIVTFLILLCVDEISKKSNEYIIGFYNSAADMAIYIAESDAKNSIAVIVRVEEWVKEFLEV